MSKPALQIALALVWREGKLLIARRPADAHLGGLWEFPGGKIEPGESPGEAAIRETREETGVVARAGTTREPICYEYPERIVTLIPVECEWLAGEAEPLGCTACLWVTPGELKQYDFPPANDPLIETLATDDRRLSADD